MYAYQLYIGSTILMSLCCSDVVVQIVDARNPMLFRCEDLEAYVKEVDPLKINMLLINKADLLTDAQRSVIVSIISL